MSDKSGNDNGGLCFDPKKMSMEEAFGLGVMPGPAIGASTPRIIETPTPDHGFTRDSVAPGLKK